MTRSSTPLVTARPRVEVTSVGAAGRQHVLAEEHARDVALVVHVGDLGRVRAARLQPDKVRVQRGELLVAREGGRRAVGADEKVDDAGVEALQVQREVGGGLARGGLGGGDAVEDDFGDLLHEGRPAVTAYAVF